MPVGDSFPNKRENIKRLYLVIILIIFLQFFILNRDQKSIISYSEFLSFLDKGSIQEVLISNDKIQSRIQESESREPKWVLTYRVNDPELIHQLKSQKVKFSEIPQANWMSGVMTWIGSFLLLLILWRFLFARIQGTSSEIVSFGKSKAKVYVERDLKTKFSDVAGVDEAKLELKEVVDFLKSPQKFTKLGGRMPKGILLVGPPGTGKTLLARAVAGEAGVSFFSINGSEFVEMFVGLGAARVRDLFQQARKNIPCIIFIDELDALGKSRGISMVGGGANEEKEQTLNQLLAELDGFDPSPGVVLLAATNRPEILDPALLRSGRFDRQIAIDKPDLKGREAILKIHLKKIQISKDIDPTQLASITSGFSGADLENLVNESALVATRRSAENVEMDDFTQAVERIVGGMERKSRVMSIDEKRRVACHEMGHATVSLVLNEFTEIIHKVSIIPRGIGALGYVMRRPVEDRYLMSQFELENKIIVLLGGRSAEEHFYGNYSTGAADDLEHVTEIARSMVMQYGMSKELGMLAYEKIDSLFLAGGVQRINSYSEETAQIIDHEIINLVRKCYQKALEIITEHRKFIEEGIELLMKKESLNESELRELKVEYFPKKGKMTIKANSVSIKDSQDRGI